MDEETEKAEELEITEAAEAEEETEVTEETEGTKETEGIKEADDIKKREFLFTYDKGASGARLAREEAAAALDVALRLPRYEIKAPEDGRRFRSGASADSKHIAAQITQLKKDLRCVENNFNEVDDPILMDYFIYERLALNKKFEYFLRLCREKGLSVDAAKY